MKKLFVINFDEDSKGDITEHEDVVCVAKSESAIAKYLKKHFNESLIFYHIRKATRTEKASWKKSAINTMYIA